MKYNLDAIIMPGFAMPAVKHGFSNDLPSAACYTFLWNILDFPAGSLPITTVNNDE